MPTRSAADLSPPIRLGLVPELLRRRGVEVARKRLQEAAAGGAIPVRRQGARYLVAEADLDALAAYFRANPAGPGRGGAAGLARAGRR